MSNVIQRSHIIRMITIKHILVGTVSPEKWTLCTLSISELRAVLASI